MTGVNNLGQAAGYYVTYDGSPTGQYTAFTVSADGSGFASYIRPGTIASGFAGINDAGAIAGVSVDGSGLPRAFVREAGGGVSDRHPPIAMALLSEAVGINDAGVTVGWFDDGIATDPADQRHYHRGFIYDPALAGTAFDYTAFDVNPALGDGTQLISVNNAGVLAGNFYDLAGTPHGFIQAGGSFTALPFASQIGQINNGDALSYNILTGVDPLSPTGFSSIAVISNGAASTVLSKPGAAQTYVLGLNDRLQATGLYTDGTGIHGFVASFVPEPASWALLIGGFGLCGAGARRRRSGLAAA